MWQRVMYRIYVAGGIIYITHYWQLPLDGHIVGSTVTHRDLESCGPMQLIELWADELPCSSRACLNTCSLIVWREEELLEIEERNACVIYGRRHVY